ncbi:uncharacterized protein LOC123300422 [Chrysoperla carnea]|uniref:uncharacterized protein LOC123300422 n=1 Tax=Chrysoperla carnea TaxID=189513 RepID=UPI001D06E19E|nr:uncharacterized protein LOC123300422 [Chrysoperla carnea]
MAKLTTSLIICIVLISTIFTFVHSDQMPNFDICSISLCAAVQTPCPPGLYLVPKDPSVGRCCDTCESYAKLGAYCNETVWCHPNLICPVILVNGEYSPDSVCSFLWENREPKCDTTYCPTYETCPNGTTLVKHNGANICCDQCVDHAKFGEYCDNTVQCLDGLHCTNNVCTESDFCNKEKQLCVVPKDCGSDEYIIPPNGLDRCCDTCGSYAKLGEACDPESKRCETNTYCDSYSNTCTKPQIACSCAPAFEKDCLNGVWIPPNEAPGSCSCGYCKLDADN